MQIILNVSEDIFSELINKEIQDFPKEKIQEIIQNGLIEAMGTVGKNLFIKQEKDGWSSNYRDVPSDVVLYAAKNFDLSPSFKEIETKMINTLNTDCEKFISKALADIICRGICNSNDFNQQVHMALLNFQNK